MNGTSFPTKIPPTKNRINPSPIIKSVTSKHPTFFNRENFRRRLDRTTEHNLNKLLWFDQNYMAGTKSTKKDLEAKIAELEEKLAKLATQIEAPAKPAASTPPPAPKPAPQTPPQTQTPPPAPKPAPAATSPRGSLPAGMK
ncbi:MAG: hypothetical protein QXE84_06800, partial [Candidatus Nitrosotenuis sp.]